MVVIVVVAPPPAQLPVSVMAANACPADEHHALEVPPEGGVQGEVDDGVVARVRHGQPVSAQPYDVHVGEVVDGRVVVAHHRDDVKGQPAHGVDHHHYDDHFHELARKERGK